MERYQRQITLKEIGIQGQQRLLAAKVLVVGAGGLGCPVLQYLAAAGVGTIGIADNDTVQLSNLHRQILYTQADIGQLKTTVAAARLSALNPDITINCYPVKLTNQNAWDIVTGYDLVIDGSDNFETRYMVNDVCALQQKPLVYASIFRYEGQVAVFNLPTAQNQNGVHYRHLFPQPPQNVLNCAEAGVLGILPGITGTLQAAEAIKIITKTGQPLANQILIYNMLNHQQLKVDIPKNPLAEKFMPLTKTAFETFDYVQEACGFGFVKEIDATGFLAQVHEKNTTIVDVREPEELPIINQFPNIKIPLSTISAQDPALFSDNVIVFCASGKRSAKACEILSTMLPASSKIVSLKDGILSLVHLL